MNNNNFDPSTRAVRCEKCGEWWHQGASHRCKPTAQYDAKDNEDGTYTHTFSFGDKPSRGEEKG